MASFAERLRILRKEKHMTQTEMAKQFNQSLRAYQYYEAGRSYPEFPHLLALADFFDVSLDYLVGRSDEREKR